MSERVGFSLGRIATVAVNTFTEAVRQKVFYIMLAFALVMIASASFFSQFTFSEQLKSVKDTCLGAIAVFGTLIAIVGTAQLLPHELENRTIYTILAKPVRRVEFLLGKYLGSVWLLFLSLVMMSAMFALALSFKEHRLLTDAAQQAPEVGQTVASTLRQIRLETWDPDIAKGLLLIFLKLALLAAVTLFFSTFSSSMVFNVVATAMIFFAGHLRAPAADLWGQHRWVQSLLVLIPDLGTFNVADEINLGSAIPWAHVAQVGVYGLAYTTVVLVAAYLIFADREI